MTKIGKNILAISDLKQETITVSEWDNVNITVRGMTASCRSRFGEKAKTDPTIAIAQVIIENVLDPETGENAFEPADATALMGKSGSVIDRISKIILKLSGLGDLEAEALEKNSEAIVNG